MSIRSYKKIHVFFPGDVDRTFWEILAVDHDKLLRNAVLWATRDDLPVSVNGKGVLHIAFWMQQHSMTLHLVNLTNPMMMMKGPVREIIPISRQFVKIKIPPGKTVAKVHLLVSKANVNFRISAGMIELEVPSIDLHEVVALDLEGQPLFRGFR